MYQVGAAGRPFVETAASLACDVLNKHANDVDSSAGFPAESISALSEAGLSGLTVPEEFGGHGQSAGVFAAVVEELAQACASTAMIYVMHVAGTQAVVASSTVGSKAELLTEIAAGRHLTTLAFSERGSRSQFWAPVSRLAPTEGGFITQACKSWITSASHANSSVSSAQQPDATSPLDSTIYLLETTSAGIRLESSYDGLGLRGNDSRPVTFENVTVPSGRMLTEQGGGTDMMLQVVLPWFVVGTSAMAHGLCRAAVTATSDHLSASKFEHEGMALRDLPNLRARLADMNVRTDQSRALLAFTCRQMETPDETTPLYVLQSRLAAMQAAADVTDLAMKTCGGAAFSRHLGIERLFRDARAGWVMAPTVDHLHDFIGKALTGLPLF